MEDDPPKRSSNAPDADTDVTEPLDSTADDDDGADVSAILEDLDAVVTTPSSDADGGDDEATLPGRGEPRQTQLRWEGPGQIVYEPRIRQVGFDYYAIEGKCEDRDRIPWGFWGGLLAVAVVLLLLSSGFAMLSMWDIFWAMVAIGVGVLLYRFGERSSLREEVLCEVDVPQEQLSWPEGVLAGDDRRHLRFDQVTEIVFGMTRLPVTASDARVRVDAFTLLVRTPQDELLPIIEGSPYKEEVHEIGEFLGELTGQSMTYVGRGIQGD